MKLRIFLRPALSVVFGFLGAFIAKTGTPPEIFEVTGRAGIAALAHQIANYLHVARRGVKRQPKYSKYKNPLVIDTSALIDGRFLDVVKTGFIYGTFLIIPSVEI